MASDTVLDLETLLQPISAENPTGSDLREDSSPDSVLYQIKDARNAARAAERRASYADGLEDDGAGASGAYSRPDWKPIITLGQEVLAGKSKDLEVAVYLTEALVREHGFAGLRDGLRLVWELIEKYWDGLFPAAEDVEGMKDRVAGLGGLNAAMSVPLRAVPVTQGREFGPFTLAEYQQAADLEKLADATLKSQRIERGAVSMEVFDRAVRETSPEFYQDMLDDLEQCRDEFAVICTLLEERCGTDSDGDPLAPPSSEMRELLEACHERIAAVARDVLAGANALEGGVPGDASLATGGALSLPLAGDTPVGRAIHSRDEAFRTLLRVADFFRKTEPHSPVSYALEQAVRWGRLPLPDLLTELIPDEASREQMFKVVGIRPPGDPGDANS